MLITEMNVDDRDECFPSLQLFDYLPIHASKLQQLIILQQFTSVQPYTEVLFRIKVL